MNLPQWAEKEIRTYAGGYPPDHQFEVEAKVDEAGALVLTIDPKKRAQPSDG